METGTTRRLHLKEVQLATCVQDQASKEAKGHSGWQLDGRVALTISATPNTITVENLDMSSFHMSARWKLTRE
jgi:hypothetical protein